MCRHVAVSLADSSHNTQVASLITPVNLRFGETWQLPQGNSQRAKLRLETGLTPKPTLSFSENSKWPLGAGIRGLRVERGRGETRESRDPVLQGFNLEV